MDEGEKQKQFFPLFFKLSGQKVLVVGGGKVAVRKVTQLLDFGAEITLITPEADEVLRSMADTGRLKWQKRKYISPEAGDFSLVIATTDNREVNVQIYEDAAAKKIPINIVDKPDLCTVFFPSIIQRGNMTIAVGSDGTAPFFTRAVRKELDELIPRNYEKKILLAGEFRKFALKNVDSEEKRRILFARFILELNEKSDEWDAIKPPYAYWQKWIDEIDE